MTMEQNSVGNIVSADISIQHNARLTTAEVAQLWAIYQKYTMLTCVMSHFEKTAQDQQVKDLMAEDLTISQQFADFVLKIFENENIPIPMGFSTSDVDLEAPALFPDIYLLHYLRNMITIGITLNSLNINMASRPDIRDFYADVLDSTIQLNTKLTDTMLAKGVLSKPPYVTISSSVEHVHKTSFLTGFLGEKRPLITIEIAHLYHNALSSEIARVLLLGFRQVSLNEEVRNYFNQGIKLCDNFVKDVSTLARNENIIFSLTKDSDVKASTKPPFSDKLMMFHVFFLNTINAGMYGVSAATSARHDIMKLYGQFMIETGMYAESGIKLMMKNDWLEEPPQILDRDEIAGIKH